MLKFYSTNSNDAFTGTNVHIFTLRKPISIMKIEQSTPVFCLSGVMKFDIAALVREIDKLSEIAAEATDKSPRKQICVSAGKISNQCLYMQRHCLPTAY